MSLFDIEKQGGYDTRKPNNVDVHVGKRIREIRDGANLSQKRLADMVGITFQQLQKYENGLNRVVASRLYDFSRVLRVPISTFFANMDEETAEQSQRMQTFNQREDYVFAEPSADIDYDIMHTKKSKQLVSAYYKIKDPVKAQKIFDLVMRAAEEDSGADENADEHA